MGRPRLYTLNQDYFEQLTDNSAYIIGLIMADGTIRPDRFSISAKRSDAHFLSCIASEIGSNRPIQHVSHKYGEVSRMVVNSSKMSARLAHYGIHSPRTWTARTHPELFLNRHYWRGVIDGDGSLCNGKRGANIIRLVGAEAICSDFLIFCRVNGIAKFANVCRHKTIFTVCLNGREALQMASILYEKAELYLPRKKEIFDRWKGIANAA